MEKAGSVRGDAIREPPPRVQGEPAFMDLPEQLDHHRDLDHAGGREALVGIAPIGSAGRDVFDVESESAGEIGRDTVQVFYRKRQIKLRGS